MFAAALAEIGKPDLVASRTAQHDVLYRLRQLFKRRFDIETIVLCQRLQHLEIELITPVPAPDCTGAERQVRIGDDALRVEKADLAEAVALRARTHRIVERKQ